MSDRFGGTVSIGGRITREQFNRCEELLDEGLDNDGSSCFVESNSEDFTQLVEYCEENKIALSIQWEQKWEYEGRIEYWISGESYEFHSNSYGDVLVQLADMLKHPEMTIADFVKKMNIPDFPDLEIIDPDSPKGVSPERQIVTELVSSALSAGYSVSVSFNRGYDVEDMIIGSTDKDQIIEEAMSGDDCWMFIHNQEEPCIVKDVVNCAGWVFIVPSSGSDAITDYTENEKTESVIASAIKLANSFE